jgi:hypothetical protein
MIKERGQAYIYVLILLGMGAVMIIAMLQTINTILPTRQIYGSFIKEDYAADAAVEYGMWRLKHEDGFAEGLPIGTESDPFYVTLNGVTANTTVSAQAYEYTFEGQDLAGRAEDNIFFKVEKSVVATSTYQTLAWDDFESGGDSGGTGNWSGPWIRSGDAQLTSQSYPHEGSYHLRLRGDGGSNDGYAQREVDLSESSGDGPYLYFWAKLDNVEADNWIDVMVSANGTDWDILDTFSDDESDNIYRSYQYNLSSYGAPSTFYVAFDMDGNHSSDQFFVDDVKFLNTQEASTSEPGVLTEYTYYVTFECLDPDGCRETVWPNNSGLARIIDDLPERGAESGDYMQYIYGSTEWNVIEYNSFAYDGLESGGISGGTGNWSGSWSLTGDASISTSDPHQGTRSIRLRGAGGSSDGYAQREVNLGGTSGNGPYLSFWARVDNVESDNFIYIKVSTNGVDWTTLDTFSDDESDRQYHEYRYNLSSFGRPSSLYVAFEMDGNHNSDTINIDDIEFSDYDGLSTGLWPMDPFDPTTTPKGWDDEGRYQQLEWDFEYAGYDDVDFDYGEVRTMSFRAQAALEEGTYCNKIWVSSESHGDEGAIISGTTAKIVVGDPMESRCDGGLIVVDKISDPEIVYPYEPTTVTYTITIENVDNVDITIYEVEDWLPATGYTEPEEGFMYVDDSASGRIIRPATIAFDGFESGGLTGGTGNWSDNWTASGDYTVSNSDGPHQGTYHMKLRGEGGQPYGYAQREIDLSGYSSAELRYWAKASSFDWGEEVDVKVSTNPPVYTDIAFDGFESGGGSGGTGNWSGSWNFSGYCSITTNYGPYEGSRHLQLRDEDENAGIATREVDLTGFSDAELQFYAKLWQLESGDEVYVKVSTDGEDWDTIETFDSGDSDGWYHPYTYDISNYGAVSSFYVRFESNMHEPHYDDDYFWVDNVELVDDGGGYWDILKTFEFSDSDGQYHSYSYDLSSYGSPSSFYVAFDTEKLGDNQDYFYFDNVEFRDFAAESDIPVCMPDENLGNNFLFEDWEYKPPYWEYRWSLFWDFSNYPGENDPVFDEGGVCEDYEWADYNPYLLLSPGEIFEITFQASGTLTYSGSYYNEVFVHIDNNWYEGWLYSWPTGSVIVPQYDLQAETLNSILRANAMLSPEGHWWRSWHWWWHH